MISFSLMLFFTFCAGTAFGVKLCQGESDYRDGAGNLCLVFVIVAMICAMIYDM